MIDVAKYTWTQALTQTMILEPGNEATSVAESVLLDLFLVL